VESPAPVSTGRRASCGAGARGGRGGTRLRVISGGARERRGGAGKCHGGAGGCNSGTPQTLEEDEARLLQLEVSSASPVRP
jgi:hypothetical protein